MSSDIECNIAGISAEWDTDWHIASLFIIIGTSAVGVFLPIISQTTRGSRSFGVPGFAIQIGQFFGAGVIIATAFIHLFPAANSALTSPCLGSFADKYGAWASLIAMAAVLTMHSTEWWLVEAWMGRTKQKSFALPGKRRRRRRRMRRQYRKLLGMLGVQTTTGNDGYSTDGSSSSSCNSSDDDGDDDHMLFPAYSRAFNASRMMLPPPALSPAVTPYVFGASTVSPSSRMFGRNDSAFTSRATGFALSKYGNYAAVVQSRQHLAMISSDRISRYLYSEPQFPHYGPPLWPIPPIDDRHRRQSGRNINLGSSAQAKSTPELMNRYQKSIRKSHVSSAQSSSAKNTQSSNGVSLRPNSFSRSGKHRVRQKAPLSAESLAAKHRCLSMPRLPPTTLEAGICDSLIEPLHLPSSGYKSDNTSSLDSRSLIRSSNLSDSCASSQNPRDAKIPVSVAAAAAASRRHSLHASTVSRNARASLGEPCDSHGRSAGRLDPVPETDDSWVTSMPYRSADNVLRGLPPLSESLRTQIASGQTTYLSARTHKRVSIPTPPIQSISQSLTQGAVMQPPLPPLPLQSPVYAPSIRSDLASNGRISQSLGGSRHPRHSWQKKNCQDAIEMAAAALAGIAPRNAGSVPATDHPGKTLGTDDDQDSTAIISQQSSLTKHSGLPADVKRQALATYILEIGIALYSVLIGLALAISDHGFLALFIAICFHQFFEGLALGTSLAELYWIKTQIAAHKYEMDVAEGGTLASSEQDNADPASNSVDQPDTSRSAVVVPEALARSRRIDSAGSINFEKDMHVIDPAGFGTVRKQPPQQRNQRSMSTNEAPNSDDFEYHSAGKDYRRSKSRRTLTSMATSFTPEPWQVNPQLEVSLGNISQGYVMVGQPPEVDNAASTVATSAKHVENVPSQPRYLQPRTEPERLPGWWKAWISALAFTMTTPTGIIIGLAIRHIYEPNSVYALLLNGVLQSICTGVLIYAGLVTLMIGGFNSIQVKHMSRIRQTALFFAVYAGAAVMASLKIWK